MSKTVIYIVLLGSFSLAGCAFDLAHVSFTPTVYTPESGKSFKISEKTRITGCPCGYNRTISKDTTWNLVATIPEGEVYKSRDQVLTVECSNIHEVYLVISQGSVVGFYLPVEKGFTKLSEPISLKTD